MKNPSSVRIQDFFEGAVRIFSCGQPYDWRIGTVIKSLNPSQIKVFQRIADLAEKERIKEIYSPDSSKFNRKIAKYSDFQEKLRSPNRKVVLKRGALAEGVEIKLNQAGWFLVADCAVIVARHSVSGKTIAAHCGRDSLHPLKTKGKEKSIVYSIIKTFQKSGFLASDIFVYVVGGIGPENFYHKWNNLERNEGNKKIILYFKKEFGENFGWLYGDEKDGGLNLFEIIRRQFMLFEVPSQNISRDNTETFSEKNEKGKFLWYSHRRGDKGRNGIMVVRKS